MIFKSAGYHVFFLIVLLLLVDVDSAHRDHDALLLHDLLIMLSLCLAALAVNASANKSILRIRWEVEEASIFLSPSP